MRAEIRVRLCGAAVAGLLVLVGCGPRTTPPITAPAPSTGVAVRVLELYDPGRPTGTTPGRQLPTQVRYPESGAGPFPVIVFSHGLGSQPSAYDELLSAWAAAGFVVAAPTFPLTADGSAQLVDDVLNQPADVAFVLTAVLALADTRGDPLAGRIDPHRVAVAGHSAGAVTTIGVLSRCCADPRVTAAIVLAGTTRGFGTDLASPGVPTLFVHGGADQVIPPAEGRAVYDAAPGPAAWLELPGASHSAPYDDDADPAFDDVRVATTSFLRWTLADDAAALQALRTGVTPLTADRLTPR